MQLETAASRFRDAQLFIAPDALKFVAEDPNSDALVGEVVALESKPLVITLELVQTLAAKLAEDKIPLPEKTVVIQAPDWRPVAKDMQSDIAFLDKYDVTGKSRCTGSVDDFVRYFKDRLARTRGVLRSHMSEHGVTELKAVASAVRGRKMRLIGMVTEKRQTKNGHYMLTIEDEESQIAVLCLKDDPVLKKADQVALDEVIAIDGSTSGNFVIGRDIVWPDIPARSKQTVDSDAVVAHISDTHMGSKLFMQREFERFIAWLNGRWGDEKQKALAGRVKYVLFAGDCVDGVGIYPKQEKELVAKDIYKQYAMFTDYIAQIPEWIEVVIAPGNHDAVRRADPQPALAPDLVPALKGLRNVHLVGSPSYAQIEGLKFLVYHGNSMHSMVAGLPGLSIERPEKIMIEMLRRRNMCPVYGSLMPIVPEERDFLFIDAVPDVFHTGDVHHNGYDAYRGTTVLNSGTFQSVTDYQIKLGHTPTPAIVPVYELRSGNLSIINFGESSG